MEIKKTFWAKGHVLGNYWGGGRGSYPSVKIHADSEEELLKIAEAKLKDGSLDSGMGYESLIGARLEVTTIEIVVIDNKTFTHESSVGHFIGDLSDEQQDFLDEVYFNS